MKNLKYIIASIIIFVVIVLVSGEIIARVFGAINVYEYDKVLGWSPKKNFVKKLPVIDKSGEKYFINYSTNEYGFREFGNVDSSKLKILFVGDSWTGDPNTSDDDAYFGIVKNELPVEVFAIGGGGYGTLQEMLLVKKYSKIIDPDIFILQYCDNDLINNSYFLEGPSIVRNQKNLRPYWVDHKIVYRKDRNDLFVFLYKNFRLFRSLDGVISTLQYKLYKGYYPEEYAAYGRSGPATSAVMQAKVDSEKAASIQTTEQLMLEMRKYLPPGTKLVTFPASADDSRELEIWQSMAKKAGFTTYPSVAVGVEAAEREGKTVRVQDGAHWNRLGNKIAGEELVKIIRRDFL